MSKQEWSKEVPVEDGWYWVRQIDDTKKGIKHHVVMLMDGWIHNVLAMEPIQSKAFKNGDVEWLVPLTPPE